MASEEKDTNDPDFKVEKSGSAKKERKFLYNKNWEEVPEFRGEKITIFSFKTHFQSWKTQCTVWKKWVFYYHDFCAKFGKIFVKTKQA